jgi:nucleoside-diphosphate-sugar epimerase
VIRPDTPVDPLLWYDVGKIVNERQVRHASGEDGRGPGISLRPTFFIGASPRARDRQLFTEIYDACRSGRTFVFETEQSLETSGCAFIGLEDFSRAVVAALGMSMSGEFPLAGGFTRWRDLIDLINERAHGTGRYIVRKDGAKGDEVRLAHSRTELDSSAFEAATGWRPRESIDHLVDAFVRDDR